MKSPQRIFQIIALAWLLPYHHQGLRQLHAAAVRDAVDRRADVRLLPDFAEKRIPRIPVQLQDRLGGFNNDNDNDQVIHNFRINAAISN